MTERLPADRLQTAGLIVVKIGTNVLADAAGRLDRERIRGLVAQLAAIRARDQRIILVSSGAIGAGVGRLGLRKRPSELPQLQACAAVGQGILMATYQEFLDPHGITAGQVLLTAGDFDHRVRYLNVRHTLRALLDAGCLPIINENDTVAVAEIRFGDNDRLAAQVAHLVSADLLVLLTNVDGLYTANPQADPSARLIPVVEKIDSDVLGMAASGKSHLGTGGMDSKLRAARLAARSGVGVVMANGSRPDVLDAVFAGEPVGTYFPPHPSRTPARKGWLGHSTLPKGSITIDAGAEDAIVRQGKSLLPIGVTAVQGGFARGDVVRIDAADGREVGRGLTNYASEQIERMRGLSSEQVRRALGEVPYAEVIHRDQFAPADGPTSPSNAP